MVGKHDIWQFILEAFKCRICRMGTGFFQWLLMSLYKQYKINKVYISWTHATKHSVSTCRYFWAIPAKSWHNRMWPPSTKLRGLYRVADRNEDQRTGGGVKLVKPVMNLWSRALIHSHSTIHRVWKKSLRFISTYLCQTLTYFHNFWHDSSLSLIHI